MYVTRNLIKIQFYGIIYTSKIFKEREMKQILFCLIITAFVATDIQSQTTGIGTGIGIGIRSSSMHPQYPIEVQKQSMQTSMGLQVDGEAFSSFLLGRVDLIGYSSYEGEMSQGLRGSNALKRTYGTNIAVEVENVLEVMDGEEGQGMNYLASSLSVVKKWRVIGRVMEGRISGGYNYNPLHTSLFLVRVGVSIDILTCNLGVNVWKGETSTVTGTLSKEMEFYKLTFSTMTDKQRSKMWLGVSMHFNDVLQ